MVLTSLEAILRVLVSTLLLVLRTPCPLLSSIYTYGVRCTGRVEGSRNPPNNEAYSYASGFSPRNG